MELATILKNDWWCTIKHSPARTLERTNDGWLRSTGLDGAVWNATDVFPIPYEFVIDTDSMFSGHIENLQLNSDRLPSGVSGYVRFNYKAKWDTSFTRAIPSRRMFLSFRVLGVLVACWELHNYVTTVNDTFLVTYKSFEKIDYRPPIVFDKLSIFNDCFIRGTMKPKKWGSKVLHYKLPLSPAGLPAGLDELQPVMTYFEVNPSRFFIEVAKFHEPRTNS